MIGRFLSESADPHGDVEKVRALKRSSGYAHNLVTIAGNVLAVESTAAELTAFTPQLPYTHTNHYMSYA